MSDILGMSASEYALTMENARLRQEIRYLKETAGVPAYSVCAPPEELLVCQMPHQLLLASQSYVRDDGIGYHCKAKTYSGLHVGYYLDRTTMLRMGPWQFADLFKAQLEDVSRGLIEALKRDVGLPTLLQNLDHPPAPTGAPG